MQKDKRKKSWIECIIIFDACFYIIIFTRIMLVYEYVLSAENCYEYYERQTRSCFLTKGGITKYALPC